MILSFCRINVEERKKKQALTFPIFKDWSSLVKTGRSPISWAQKTLYQTRDLLVRTSLWEILLVLTNNVLAAKANTTLACERNPMATVRFSFITVTQPQHHSGVQFYRKKKCSARNGCPGWANQSWGFWHQVNNLSWERMKLQYLVHIFVGIFLLKQLFCINDLSFAALKSKIGK